MFVFFKLTPNICDTIVSYCILLFPVVSLLYPIVSHCILLYPIVSYCILLYPTVSYLYPIVSYCIILPYYPFLAIMKIPAEKMEPSRVRQSETQVRQFWNSGPLILKLRSANSDRNSGPPSSNLRRNPADLIWLKGPGVTSCITASITKLIGVYNILILL